MGCGYNRDIELSKIAIDNLSFKNFCRPFHGLESRFPSQPHAARVGLNSHARIRGLKKPKAILMGYLFKDYRLAL